MNLYFLVEGKRTEMILYPKWMQHLKPAFKKIDNPFALNNDKSLNNTYYLFSGQGYPSILDNHLRNAIDDVNKIPEINYLIICVDTEERTVEETKNEIFNFMMEKKLALKTAKLIVITQKCCIETWLLGNRRIFPRNSSDPEFLNCKNHFNIKDQDPELMDKDISKGYNRAHYHGYYLKQLFKERNLRYSKNNPGIACDKDYLDELISRNKNTGHISTFGELITYLNSL